MIFKVKIYGVLLFLIFFLTACRSIETEILIKNYTDPVELVKDTSFEWYKFSKFKTKPDVYEVFYNATHIQTFDTLDLYFTSDDWIKGADLEGLSSSQYQEKVSSLFPTNFNEISLLNARVDLSISQLLFDQTKTPLILSVELLDNDVEDSLIETVYIKKYYLKKLEDNYRITSLVTDTYYDWDKSSGVSLEDILAHLGLDSINNTPIVLTDYGQLHFD